MLVVGRFPIIKLASSLQFNLYILFPIRFEMRFCLQLDKAIPKCIWNNKEPRIAKTILKKKERKRKENLPCQISVIATKL